MKITFKHCRIATAIIVALSISSCARFETRMQANGSFEYQNAELKDAYNSGDFTTHEARNQYDIPALTEQQKTIGLQGVDVDVRPPTQLLAVIDGVLLAKDQTGRTKIWVNSVDQNGNVEDKIWKLITSYLNEKNIDVVSKDAHSLQTGIYSDQVVFGNVFNKNVFLKESSYQITVESNQDDNSVGLIVDALSYVETNEDKQLKLHLTDRTKQDIELRFINELLEYAYQVQQTEQLIASSSDTQPLAIKLGFDDNHQSAWIAESNFEDTWRKLPKLLTLLSFTMVENDKNLGYYLVLFNKPSSSYWAENDLNPFELNNAEYFVQLGEVNDGTTSIVWLDEDKKPLSDEKIADIYLSITKYLREAFSEKERQTKRF